MILSTLLLDSHSPSPKPVPSLSPVLFLLESYLFQRESDNAPPPTSKQKQPSENKLQEGSKKPLRDNDIEIFKGRRLGKASQERDEVDLEAAEEAKSSPPPQTECCLRLSIWEQMT